MRNDGAGAEERGEDALLLRGREAELGGDGEEHGVERRVHRGREDAVRRAADRREVPERVQEALAVGDQAGLRAVEELVVDAELRDARHAPDRRRTRSARRPAPAVIRPRRVEEAPRATHGAER